MPAWLLPSIKLEADVWVEAGFSRLSVCASCALVAR